MSDFILFYLVAKAVFIITEKYNLKLKINQLSSRKSNRFLYNLSECDFCIEFHITNILLLFFVLYSIYVAETFNIVFIFYSLMTASLNNILKGWK